MAAQFVFPFELVEKDSRVALYGAGKVGQSYYCQIMATDYCKLVYWIDSNYELKEMPDIPIKVVGLTEVDDSLLDYIVVSINDEIQAHQAIEQIKNALPFTKVVWRKPDKNTSVDFFDNKQRREKLKIINLIDAIDNYNGNVSIATQNEMLSYDYSSSGRIKVRFFYAYPQFWNVMKSVAIACENDDRFDVMFVGCECENIKSNIAVRRGQVEELHIKYAENTTYDISLDRPDIAVVICLYSSYSRLIREHSKKVVCLYPLLTKPFGLSIESTYKYMSLEVENLGPDNIIIDCNIFHQMEKAGIVDKRLKCFANPKFDDIYKSIHEEYELPNGWNKLKGKKIVLWSTDHHWNSGDVSFDDYAATIIRYFDEHPEMGCIFRPHRVLIMELLGNRVWSKLDLDTIKEYFYKSPNLVWDDTPSYYGAYSICDAVLVDLACGMIISSLPLNVPVAGMYRKDGTSKIADYDVAESLYRIDDDESLVDFFEMVSKGLDPQKDKRNALMSRYIEVFDGRNGERIKDYLFEIVDKINE